MWCNMSQKCFIWIIAEVKITIEINQFHIAEAIENNFLQFIKIILWTKIDIQAIVSNLVWHHPCLVVVSWSPWSFPQHTHQTFGGDLWANRTRNFWLLLPQLCIQLVYKPTVSFTLRIQIVSGIIHFKNNPPQKEGYFRIISAISEISSYCLSTNGTSCRIHVLKSGL